MYFLQRRSEAFSRAVAFWAFAPAVPVLSIAAAAAVGLSEDGQRLLLTTVSATCSIVALVLSIAGGAALRVTVRTRSVPRPALVLALVAGLAWLTVGQGLVGTLLPAASQNDALKFFLTAWLVLGAYQIKIFWDQAVADWQADRWRAFLPELRRFTPTARRLAKNRRLARSRPPPDLTG